MGMKIRMYGGGGGGEQANGGNGGGGNGHTGGNSSARMDSGGQSSSMMPIYPVSPHMYGGETSRMMEYPVYSPMTPPHARQMGFVSPDFRSGGEEMHHGGRRHSPDEGREGSYSRYEDEGGQGAEWPQKLKMGLKKLERKLDEMLEKIEDESQSKHGSKRRHKKQDDDGDDEDDEDDHGPLNLDAIMSKAPPIDCLRNIPGIVSAAVEVIGNPPETWPPYLHKEDYIGIFRMEGNELIQAVEDGKSLRDVDRELTHTTAAMLLLCARARQQDHD